MEAEQRAFMASQLTGKSWHSTARRFLNCDLPLTSRSNSTELNIYLRSHLCFC